MKKYSEIMTGKSIVIYSVGKNDNFTSKEFEDRVLEIFARKDYQIDVRRWVGMTAVYNHFERIMMTLERNLRNEKTGNEKIIKQTYIIRKHKETNTKETNKIYA